MEHQKNTLMSVLFLLFVVMVEAENEQNYLIRIGKIKILESGHTAPSEIEISYEEALSQAPSGVFVSLRSHTHNAANLNCVDYEFTVSGDNSQTGFSLKYLLQQTCALGYTNVKVNYLAVGSSLTSTIYTSVSSSYRTTSVINPYLKVTYNIPTTKQYTYIGFSLIAFRMQFGSGKIYCNFSKILSPTNINLVYAFPSNANLVKLNLSLLCFMDPTAIQQNYIHYSWFQFNKASLSKGYVNKSVENIIYLWDHISSSMQSKIDFSIDSTSLTAIQIKQNNTNPNSMFFIEITFKDTNCPIKYPYLDNLTYTCYKECQDTKYPNGQNICTSCSLCTNSINCLKCYDTYCIQNMFFTNSTNPFSCLLCSVEKQDCIDCIANMTGVYCILCNTSNNKFLNSQGDCEGCMVDEYLKNIGGCQKCNVTLSNCSTCSIDGTSCNTCIVGSNTEIVSGHCVLCNSTSFFDTVTSACALCSSELSNCSTCSIDGTSCNTCIVGSNTEIVSGHCVLCNSTSFFDTVTSACALCSSELSNCSTCSIDGTSCNTCIVGSNTEIVSGHCVLCNSTSFFDTVTSACALCSSELSNCSTCSIDGTSCNTCIVGSNTEIVSGHCVLCNSTSFFDTVTLSCKQCFTSLSNCNQCFTNISGLYCSLCYPLFNLQNNICISLPSAFICNNTYLTNCQLCPNSTCIKCIPTSQTELKNGRCISCDMFSYFSDQQKCYSCFMNYTKNSQKISTQCSFLSSTQQVLDVTKIVISLPTLNIFTNAFVQLFATIDDLSYYIYHNIDYFEPLKAMFEMALDAALARFLPNVIQQFISQLTDKKIISRNNQTNYPLTYSENREDVYFLNNTIIIWIGHLPLSFGVFFLFSLIHWIINKCTRNDLFRPYYYSGMIVVSLLNGNIQYFSFRCFSNLYHFVPLDKLSYINILVSHLVLIIILIYSISGIRIFQLFYPDLKDTYIITELFCIVSNKYFVIYNVLKILTGFIHAYFFYYPITQSILLAITYGIKCSFVSGLLSTQTKRRYFLTSEFIGEILMLVFEMFILVELVSNYYDYQLGHVFLVNIGTLQVIMVLIMIINKIHLAFMQLFRVSLLYFMKMFNIYIGKAQIKNQADIRVTRQRTYIRQPTKHIHRKNIIQKSKSSSKSNNNNKFSLQKKYSRKQTDILFLKKKQIKNKEHKYEKLDGEKKKTRPKTFHVEEIRTGKKNK